MAAINWETVTTVASSSSGSDPWQELPERWKVDGLARIEKPVVYRRVVISACSFDEEGKEEGACDIASLHGDLGRVTKNLESGD